MIQINWVSIFCGEWSVYACIIDGHKSVSVPPTGTEWKFMTSDQKNILKMEFENNPLPKTEEQHQLATSLNISVERIGAWYARRRFLKRKAGLPIEGEYT